MTNPVSIARRTGAAAVTFTMVLTASVVAGSTAHAGDIVPTVELGTAANYAVLGSSTVTNSGSTVLDGSLGVSPGDAITGFPPGKVLPPGTIDAANEVAQQARADLRVAYLNAGGRPISPLGTTEADLANRHLEPGVYAGPSKSPLSLTGPLVLDGMNNLDSVFIFQTNSTLTTGTGSTVSLINGAQECNVFWQVGSSATLGTGSVFRGNILALTSISVNDSVTVHGRALALNGAVTLLNDTFTKPTCQKASTVTPTTTTTTTPADTTTTTVATGSGTGVTTVGTSGGSGTGGTSGTGGGSTSTGPDGSTSTATSRQQTTTGRLTSQGLERPGSPGVPSVVGPPRTGVAPFGSAGFPWGLALLVSLLAAAVTMETLRRRGAEVHSSISPGC